MNRQMNSTIGLVGVKLGMSRLFKEEGSSVPVTLVYAHPNRICQIKTDEKDGYSAVQVVSGEQKPQRVSKALRGHYAKVRVPVGRCLTELRVTKEQAQQLSSLSAGGQLDVKQFVEGQRVDLIGISKGKGFAGAIKRWNFSSQDASHGNSISHRHLGSTGQCQFPGKVWKGKKMAGHYGNERVTTMRLEVAAIDEENHLLMIKGAVPGAEGSKVIVRPSHKQTAAEIERVEKVRVEKEAAVAQQQEEEVKEKEEKAEEGAANKEGVIEKGTSNKEEEAVEEKTSDEEGSVEGSEESGERVEEKVTNEEGVIEGKSDEDGDEKVEEKVAHKEEVIEEKTSSDEGSVEETASEEGEGKAEDKKEAKEEVKGEEANQQAKQEEDKK